MTRRLTDILATDSDRPAVWAAGRELSYRDLSDRAGEIADSLARHGHRPGDIVGVHTSDPHRLVPAAVGILRAGCAYLPLDPAAPSSRWAQVTAKIGVRTVLTASGGHGEIGGLAMAAQADGGAIGVGDVAYAVLTSGSTGVPKAVAVGHDAAVASTLARREVYPGRVERFLWHSPPAFDSSMAVLFWTLADGGTLVVPDHDTRLDPAKLAEFLHAENVTHTLSLPRVWRGVLASAAPGQLGTVTVAIVAGEAVPPELVGEHAERSSAPLWNEYGPAEGSVWASWHRCAPGEDVVPIGAARPGITVHVLDDELRHCPAGRTGEIWLSGPGLARGYPGDPAQTAARFVPSPFEPGCRAYRTGDLAAWNPAGSLEFRGRRDDQVKVSGVRVEPAEVERVLRGVPGVGDAAVVAHSPRPGSTVLVGYVIAAGDVDAGQIRSQVGDHLPPPMVPARIVALRELPRNANGKVDRAALSERPLPADDIECTAPAEVLDAVLAAWCSALQAQELTGSTDLFAAGGDSITAVVICSRLGEKGLAATPAEVFEARTPAALASLIADRPAEQTAAWADTGTLTAPPDGRPALPLNPVQRWFVSTGHRLDHWNFSIGIDVAGDFDRVRAALMEILERQPMLSARFEPAATAGDWRVRPGHGAVPAVLELGSCSAEHIARRTAYWQQTLNLRAGPVARLVWFQDDNMARAVLVTHHMVTDAVSWRVVLNELSGTLTAPSTTSRPPEIPQVPPQHDYADELPLWMERARAAATPVLDVDPGTEGTAVRSTNILNGPVVAGLLRQAVRPGGADALLLSALTHGFASVMPQLPWLGVEVETHGRTGPASTASVGWFTSFHPVAIPLAAAGGPAGALTAVQQALADVPGDGSGYLALSYPAGPPNDLSMVPPPPVGFNYFGRVETGVRAGSHRLTVDFQPPGQRAPDAARRHLFDVDCLVAGADLVFVWTHPDDLVCAATAAKLVTAVSDALGRCLEVADVH